MDPRSWAGMTERRCYSREKEGDEGRYHPRGKEGDEGRCHSRGSGNLWLPIDSGSPLVGGDDRGEVSFPRKRESMASCRLRLWIPARGRG